MTTLFQNRNNHCSDLLSSMAAHNCGQFENFCRMSTTDMQKLLERVGPMITKQDTFFRTAIGVKERLAVTLRFLASGDSYTDLSYLFRVSKQAISGIVPEVCRAIITTLHDEIKVCMSVRAICRRTVVPNLGYMYPQWYIFALQGVHRGLGEYPWCIINGVLI